ncbi:MAG: NAD(P)-dependent oxidoreductase [Alphaproteobacteria bacterium]
MAHSFRVALSGDFKKPDGSPVFPDFDVSPLFQTSGVEVVYLEPGPAIQAEQVADIDVLILLMPKFDARSIHPNGRLAAVARFGVGYDSVDVPACSAANIPLVITPDGVRRPVAVSILTYILSLTGKLMVKDRITREGPDGFNTRGQFMGVGLVGKTLGSLGVGNIGAEMFRICKPLDMRYIAHDPYADPKIARELGIELVGLEDLFRHADILTVNCPLTETTRHIVNAERLALMKPTSFFINTARGPIVDQKALTKVLQENRIAGAGLDVFEIEPVPSDDPILTLENAILAPHALCWTDQCFSGNGAADVKAALDIRQGIAPRGVVNREVLDSTVFKAKLANYAQRFV